MKNLFNDISQEEKNRILEMHSSNKTLLKEATLDQSAIQIGGKRIIKCFDSNKYPNTFKAAQGSAKVAFGLCLMNGAVVGELFSFGLATVPAVLVGAAGVAETSMGIKKIYDANISRIDNELKALYHCVFG